MLLGARMAAWSGGKTLPYEFIEKVHFDGSATCYIDTGFYANTTTTRFVGALSFDNFETARGVLGSRNKVGEDESCNLFIIANKLRLDWTYGSNQFSTRELPQDSKINLDVSRPMTRVNGFDYHSSYSYSFYQKGRFLIGNFTNADASPFSYGLLGYCYESRIYSYNEIVRHYMPCVRKSDGAIGFYEEIGDTFTTNQGFEI